MTRILLTKEEKQKRARIRWRRWANDNREHLRETVRAWKKNNPEKVAANNRRYAEAHPDKIREKWQRHQSLFPEKCTARTARYTSKNREKVNAGLRAYFQTDAGKRARVNGERRRRAKKMGADPVATAKEISALLMNAVICCYCRIPFGQSTPPTVDHIIPLARGGTHRIANLAASCGACNSKKGTSMPEEFLARANFCIDVGNFT